MKNGNILEVNDLSVAFQNETGLTEAVKDVSFYLKEGETLGIVGESGSGKSVTAMSVLRLIASPPGKILDGKVEFRSKTGQVLSLFDLKSREMREIRGREISMIFQEPMTALNPVFTCGDQVAEAIRAHERCSRVEAKRRTLALFEEVHLPRPAEIWRSYPHEISGGQKQRVMIAMAISCNPRILIADEPTTALDVTVQKTILDLLRELQAKRGMSIIFITHDLALVSGFADRVIVMYRGKIVEEGSVSAIFSHPKHPYTKGLIACRPPAGTRYRHLPTVEDFVNKDGTREITGEKEFVINDDNIITKPERETRLEKIIKSEPVIRVEAVGKQFRLRSGLFAPKQNLDALQEITFHVYPGETLGIVGESGCGKTTLGRTILHLIPASAGKIFYRGTDISSLSVAKMKKLRKQLQIIFQDPFSSLNPQLTIGYAITEPMKVHGLHGNDKARKEKAMELLEQVGLKQEHYYRYPHEFSGGQRQRICIARALAIEPEVIICDESVSALDVSVQAQVLNLLNDLKTAFGLTYLFISHDLSVVRFMSDRLIVMKSGKIVEMGESDAIFANPSSDYTKTLLAAVPKIQTT